jgi:hypothetical protein
MGRLLDLRDLGWEDHYIWRLFAGVVVTGFAGFLAGAIAKYKGALVSAVSNVPSILVWGAMVYLAASANASTGEGRGFLVVSVVAIPLTTWIAYAAGGLGERIQAKAFPENTVLGIWPYHWLWLMVLLYSYGLGIIFVVAKSLAVLLHTWGDRSFVDGFAALLALIPVVAWFYPLAFTYKVLRRQIFFERSPGFRFIVNLGVSVAGPLVATGLQVACYWILNKFL